MARILHLISHMEEGGAQRQLSYVISLAKKYDFEVAALIASPPDRIFPPLRQLQIPVHNLSHSGDFYAPEIVRNLRALLREKRYALVHCWMFESIIQGAIASRLEGIPCVAAPRALIDMLRWGANKAWETAMVRKALALADLTLFVSHTMAADYCSSGWVDPERARIVQNGVDCDFFQPAGAGKGLVTVGRISREKGYAELAGLMRLLRKELPDLECIAAGGGDHDGQDGIMFTGFIEDVRPVLARGAVYITTSATEGMSSSLLESQAMGLPAVARNIGSNSEVIEPGVNGFLAETIEDFAARCTILLSDGPLRAEMGQAARRRMIEGFSIQRQVEKIESVYGELL